MKISLIIASFLAASNICSAQLNPSFVIKAGVVSSTIKGDATKSLESLLDFTNGMITSSGRTSYYTGIFATIPLSKIVSIEPFLNYAQKGYQLQGALNVKGAEFLDIHTKAALDLQYVELPLVLKANVRGLQFSCRTEIVVLNQIKLENYSRCAKFYFAQQ